MPVAQGFVFSGVHAGIKPTKKDLALVFSATPCSAAACLTVNAARAAPVIDAAQRVPAPEMHGVIINSGNANALTGTAGLDDVAQITQAVSSHLKVPASSMLMASTGVIGVQLPKEKIVAALPVLVDRLKAAPESAAEAIATTDTRLKMASRIITLGKSTVTLSAICKGSGMIAPQLATMITVITTDAKIAPLVLQKALERAMQGSFHNLTVDNEMSTNDCVFALANGLAGNKTITEKSDDFKVFFEALHSLCKELTKEIAADGEGATKLVEVTVCGAPSEDIANDLAKSIAGSSLVKAAIFGADPNWGRVLATVGARIGTRKLNIDPSHSKVVIQNLCVYDEKPQPIEPARLKARMREPSIRIQVDVRSGSAEATAWGCDLSYDYVKLNADYTSLLKMAPDGSVERDDRLSNYSPKFKVALVTQALTYISRFSSKRCVLKIGRQTLARDSLRAAFCEDVALLRSVGMVPIVVHGEAPEAAGRDVKAREVLVTGSTNADLVTLLNRSGSAAFGLSGQDGAFLQATASSREVDGSALGSVQNVNTDLLEMLVQKNYVPVIAPVGLNQAGGTLPLDADEVAAHVAGAMKASKLVYLTGRAGITEHDELVRQLTPAQLESLLSMSDLTANVRSKGTSALKAISLGVERVHIIDARVPHSLIAELFTDDGVGTLVANG